MVWRVEINTLSSAEWYNMSQIKINKEMQNDMKQMRTYWKMQNAKWFKTNQMGTLWEMQNSLTLVK